MAWIAADNDGNIYTYTTKPERNLDDDPIFLYWTKADHDREWRFSKISERTCEDLTGKVLTWDDEPIEI